MQLLYLCGAYDSRRAAEFWWARGVKVEFAETAGGHEWKVWRLLADFAPCLFR